MYFFIIPQNHTAFDQSCYLSLDFILAIGANYFNCYEAGLLIVHTILHKIPESQVDPNMALEYARST